MQIQRDDSSCILLLIGEKRYVPDSKCSRLSGRTLEMEHTNHYRKHHFGRHRPVDFNTPRCIHDNLRSNQREIRDHRNVTNQGIHRSNERYWMGTFPPRENKQVLEGSIYGIPPQYAFTGTNHCPMGKEVDTSPLGL